MRGILVAARTSVHPNFAAVLSIEAIQDAIIQFDERVQEPTRRIEFQGQVPLGEIHLYAMSAGCEAFPDVAFSLGYQIVQEFFPTIARQFVFRIKQAESRHGDHRLLQRPLGIATGCPQEGSGMHAIIEKVRQSAEGVAACAAKGIITPSGASFERPASG